MKNGLQHLMLNRAYGCGPLRGPINRELKGGPPHGQSSSEYSRGDDMNSVLTIREDLAQVEVLLGEEELEPKVKSSWLWQRKG